MKVAVDANILLRTTDPTAPSRPVAVAAVTALTARGDTPVLVPQVLYEFWVVATRPKEQNGLDLSAAEWSGEVEAFKSYYPLLLDPPSLDHEWERLVVTHGCRGKPAHDARYAAALHTHGITHLLTFNGSDFARFPGVVVLDPHAVAAAPSAAP